MTDPPASTSSPTNGYQGFRQNFLTSDIDPFPAPRREGATPQMTEHSVMTDPLQALTAAGVSIWLDDLSRDRLTSGSLATLVRDRYVVGVTTNPTIFTAAITRSDAYTPQIRDLAVRGVDVTEALRVLTATDVRAACDVLRPVFDTTDGVDGRVSIEVDPRLADDTEATIAAAQVLWRLVGRPNLHIKIPATKPSIPAIAACLAQGISVNVTLIFSLTRYDEVLQAFLDGLLAAHRAGHDVSRIGSVASFFVSRVDTEIDRRLHQIGTREAAALRGAAGIANARIAYAHYERMLASPQWLALAALGAHPQRPLWASTSVKDPAYPDTRYVVDLVAPGVVNTMPEGTLQAVADHGVIPEDSIRGYYAGAQRVLVRLAAVGVDYRDVVQTLEDQAVTAFTASWDRLSHQVAAALHDPVPAFGRTVPHA